MGFSKEQQDMEPRICEADKEEMSEAESSMPSSSTDAVPQQVSPKPTCAVPPFATGSAERIENPPGFTGLVNIGNTCFINSILQVLINTREIRHYFLKKYHLLEINEVNPLGMKGEIAHAFADFLRDMWSGQHTSYNPVKIKQLVAKKSTQFSGFAQHDAQEFLTFLLDGLHEDLNRILKKPMTETVEGNGRPDLEVAQEAWRRHKLRNDSIIVDLFHGQLKSRLQCPKCAKVSVTFDPFLYLPVPFPKKLCSIRVYFWPVDHYSPPWMFLLTIPEDATMKDVYKLLEERVHVDPKNMRGIESFCNKVYQEYDDEYQVSMIRREDIVMIFQVHGEEEAGEEVVELKVIQRLTSKISPVFSYPVSPPSSSSQINCAACGKSQKAQQTKVCTECYKVYYCNKDCQISDWSKHGRECQFPKSPDLVGHPFIVSLPKSQLTQKRLKSIMEARAQHSIELFMRPLDVEKVKAQSSVLTEREVDGNLEPSSPTERVAPETMEVDSPSLDLSSRVDGKPSPTESQTDDTGRSGSLTDEEPETPSRVRIVFGRTPPKEKSYKLFNIRGCDKEGKTDYTFNNGKALYTRKDGTPKLSESRFIGMDWLNKQGAKEFLKIESLQKPKSREGKNEETEEELTLDTLLGLFTESETLSDAEAWRCPQCKDEVNAEKKLALWNLPPLVILQLKRFIHTGGYALRSKNDGKVNYPVNGLDLSPYLCKEAPEQETLYDLYGVVCHYGSSFFGHYISVGCLLGEDDTKTDIGWRNFDDSRVSLVSKQHAVQESAYLLFYKKRGACTKDLFRSYEERGDEVEELEKALHDDVAERQTATTEFDPEELPGYDV